MKSVPSKTVIDADRAALLKIFMKEVSAIVSKDAADKVRDAVVAKSAELSVPTVLKIKKDKSFRKTSGYLAFCSSIREKNRKNGKLSCSVLDITRSAGDSWKKMSVEQKSEWTKEAEKLSVDAKKKFDEKVKADSDVTSETIKEMDLRKLKKVSADLKVAIPVNFKTHEIRDYLISKL